MLKLKQKLIISYGLLILIILAFSGWNIFNFVRLGRAIDVILVNNYKSILAAENMKEALERQDSAALFFINNHPDKARQQFIHATEKFSQDFQVAANNITEVGESEIIADIGQQYQAYRQELNNFLNNNETKPSSELSNYYFARFEPQFISLKDRLDDLLRLNQQAMVAANDRAKVLSWRAEVSTIAIAAIVLIFAIIFAWRFTSYVVKPISLLTEKARQISEGEFEQFIEIESSDEIGVLAAEFNRMATRLRDVRKSDNWKLLMERKKSDAVIDAIYEPVIVTDAQSHITKINRAAARIFDAKNIKSDYRANGNNNSDDNDNSDLSLSDISAGARIVQAVREAITIQRPVDAEGDAALVPIKIAGAELSFRLRTTPMRDADGRLIGAVSVLEDITSIREIDQLKTGFIKVASQKMRAPLHSLQLSLYALLQDQIGQLNEKQLDLIYSARDDAEQLDNLMSDLLELTEIESGAKKLSIELLQPTELARHAIERYRASAESKHIELDINVPIEISRVKADRQAINRIFDNLLSNALRHTDRDGKIKISASERNDRVIFSISDNGVGIPEEYLHSIFSRFVHVEGQVGGGTGLGLAMVKRLVESQGGQVGVTSHIGEGTTFTFSLPVAEPIGAKAAFNDTPLH